MPVRLTVRDEGAPESLIVSVPDAAPKADGVNVTGIVQDLPAPSDVPQVVLLTANGLPVPTVMLVMEIAAAVLFVRVAFLGALVLLTAPLPKLRLAGLAET